jgi:hypothetical protein
MTDPLITKSTKSFFGEDSKESPESLKKPCYDLLRAPENYQFLNESTPKAGIVTLYLPYNLEYWAAHDFMVMVADKNKVAVDRDTGDIKVYRGETGSITRHTRCGEVYRTHRLLINDQLIIPDLWFSLEKIDSKCTFEKDVYQTCRKDITYLLVSAMMDAYEIIPHAYGHLFSLLTVNYMVEVVFTSLHPGIPSLRISTEFNLLGLERVGGGKECIVISPETLRTMPIVATVGQDKVARDTTFSNGCFLTDLYLIDLHGAEKMLQIGLSHLVKGLSDKKWTIKEIYVARVTNDNLYIISGYLSRTTKTSTFSEWIRSLYNERCMFLLWGELDLIITTVTDIQPSYFCRIDTALSRLNMLYCSYLKAVLPAPCSDDDFRSQQVPLIQDLRYRTCNWEESMFISLVAESICFLARYEETEFYYHGSRKNRVSTAYCSRCKKNMKESLMIDPETKEDMTESSYCPVCNMYEYIGSGSTMA